jgi:glutamate synthase domain-containing protein 3
LLRRLVEQHARFTGSARAKRELGQWDRSLRHFVAVVPKEYRKAMERQSDGASSTGTRRGLFLGEARHG